MKHDIKVMVVEDNDLDMSLVTSALEADGIDYLAIKDSTKALEAAIKYQPSIAILDLNMPEVDGREVRKQLHTHPLTSHVKIIFLSASDSVEDVLYGLNVQASAYFKKGVRIGQLINSIVAIDSTAKLKKSIDTYAHFTTNLA